MKKALFIAATALALAGCQPQQGTSPSDSGVQSGSSASTDQTPPGTNNTNQSSSSQQPSQTQPNQQ